MLALLVLVGSLYHARAADISKDTNYIINQNASCPASGFFFHRETGPKFLGPGLCYLCFCQRNSTATCWKRENRRCDVEHYRDFSKSVSRTRRSPASLSEIFVRDAARDFFNKQSPEQCKPFESSFSDGCPPADWCIGCTVCDCDANGRWDCHVLSFCPDKNGKKQMKKRRGHPKNHFAKRQSKTTTNTSRFTKYTTKPPKKPTRKRFVKPNIRGNQLKQSSTINKHKIEQVKASKVNKFTSIKKPLPKLQAKKAIQSRSKVIGRLVTGRPVYIKKNVSTSKPLNLKSGSGKNNKNNTVEVAQKVVKQFITTIQKVFNNIGQKTNNTSNQVNKVLNKRSMPKQDIKKNTKEAEQKSKFLAKPSNGKDFSKRSPQKHYSPSTSKYGRIKRQILNLESSSHKSVPTHPYMWSFSNETYDNMAKKRTQNPFVNDSASSGVHMIHNFNKQSIKLTNLKNSRNREIYIIDNSVYKDNQHTNNKGEGVYNSVNDTKSSVVWIINNYSFQENASNNKPQEVVVITTDSSYLSNNFIEFNDTEPDWTQNLTRNNKDYENLIFQNEKKYPNVSTQAEDYSEDHDCKYRNLLDKLVGISIQPDHSVTKNFQTAKKPKRYTILNKIRHLLKKIFNKKIKTKSDSKDENYGDYNVKQLHNKFENCKLSSKEKEILRQRINELKSESEELIKTIGIVKDLLNTVEINTNETQYKVLNKSFESNENTNKFNIYNKTGKKVTEDQQTKISYLKDNIHVFIKSIGKFARILDKVIQIAMCHNTFNNANVYNNNNTIDKLAKDYNNRIQNKLEKLKKFVVNYNILQKNFIDHIYFILNNLEANITEMYNLKPQMRSENYSEIDKSDAIETNSANIIKNIIKLKLLAEKIHVQKRRKRNTTDDDDALEYLLILMECLLKRHAPPVYSSVDDGLDLLIEAIKSAPDIKFIRKKVLDNITEKSLLTRTIAPTNSFIKYTNYSTSSTDLKQNNISTDVNKNKIKITDQPDDDDDDDDDKIEEIYRAFKSDKHLSSEQKQDEMLSEGRDVLVTSESYYNITEETTTRKKHYRNKELIRYKAVDDYFEEKNSTATPATRAVEFESTTINVDSVIDTNIFAELKNNNNTDDFLVDSKANIDWIEENFKEIKQSSEVETSSSTRKSVIATRTHKRTESIRDVTNKINKHNEKKDDKTSAEAIMTKKQLDLLNSLDYAEDEGESKEDKFSNDAYI